MITGGVLGFFVICSGIYILTIAIVATILFTTINPRDSGYWNIDCSGLDHLDRGEIRYREFYLPACCAERQEETSFRADVECGAVRAQPHAFLLSCALLQRLQFNTISGLGRWNKIGKRLIQETAFYN